MHQFHLGRRLLLLAVFSLSAVSSAFALEKATTVQDASVRRSPDPNAEVLGRYKAGTSIRVVYPDQDGWYQILFSRPIKNASQGWVRKEDIQLVNPPKQEQVRRKKERTREQKEESRSSGGYRKGAIAFLFGLYPVSPTEFQTRISETAKSLTAKGFTLEYVRRFSKSFHGSGALGYYTVSDKQAVTGINDGLFAKGFIIQVGADYVFASTSRLDFKLGAGLGLGLSTAGNTNGYSSPAQQISTSGIISPVLLTRTMMDWAVSGDSFGFRLEGGYRIFSLSNVPVLLPSASTNGPQSTASFKLSGIYFGLGLFLNF